MAAARWVTFASDSARLARRPALWSARPVCLPERLEQSHLLGVERPAMGRSAGDPERTHDLVLDPDRDHDLGRCGAVAPGDPGSPGAARDGGAEGRPRPDGSAAMASAKRSGSSGEADSRAEPGPTRVRVGCRSPRTGPQQDLGDVGAEPVARQRQHLDQRIGSVGWPGEDPRLVVQELDARLALPLGGEGAVAQHRHERRGEDQPQVLGVSAQELDRQERKGRVDNRREEPQQEPGSATRRAGPGEVRSTSAAAIAGALTRTATLVAANAAGHVATSVSKVSGAIALKTTIASELLRLNRARLNASMCRGLASDEDEHDGRPHQLGEHERRRTRRSRSRSRAGMPRARR